jgi:4'-phosphopantetheinyl transferase
MEIYSVNITDWIYNFNLNILLDYMSKNNLAKVNKFKFREDIFRTICGEILVRNAVCYHFSMDNSEIDFVENSYGKPYLKNVDDLYFNISHSGEWVVCAIDREEIGIDIEQIKPIQLEIAENFFSAEEYNKILSEQECFRTSRFYDLWTLKESFIKYKGKGLSMPLNSFNINMSDNNNITVKTENDLDPCYFKQYNIDNRYKMAVCSASKAFPASATIMEFDELYEEFISVQTGSIFSY